MLCIFMARCTPVSALLIALPLHISNHLLHLNPATVGHVISRDITKLQLPWQQQQQLEWFTNVDTVTRTPESVCGRTANTCRHTTASTSQHISHILKHKKHYSWRCFKTAHSHAVHSHHPGSDGMVPSAFLMGRKFVPGNHDLWPWHSNSSEQGTKHTTNPFSSSQDIS